MNKLVILFLTLAFINTAQAQERPYNPDADAAADIKNAMTLAAQTGKHILITVGGNWCPWCIKLNKFCKETPAVKSFLQENYIELKVNFDKKKKNFEIMQQLAFPNRFGFPVFVVLNAKGERIHTQNSAYLEEGKGYDEKKILDFLKAWTKKATAPESYQNLK